MVETKQKKARMVRTSLQLPQELLDSLEARWPHLGQSERIRLAIERHEYVMSQSLDLAKLPLVDALAGELEDLEETSYRVAMKALHLLVPEPARERVSSATPAERLALYDAAVKFNRDRR